MRITSPFQETLNNSRIFPDTPDNSDHELDHVPSRATELVTQVGYDDDIVEEVMLCGDDDDEDDLTDDAKMLMLC